MPVDSRARPAELTHTPRRRPVDGLLLVLASILAGVGSVVLMTQFGWPDVLDAPGTEALPAFAEDATAIRAAFYALLASSLLLIPAAVTLQDVVSARATSAVRVVTVFGVLGGFSQILGWVRWPVTVPVLSERYSDASAAGDQSATSIAAAYDVLNRYAGGALGEHLGWLFQGVWAVGLAILLLRVTAVPRWLSWTGLVVSLVWWPLTWASGLIDAEVTTLVGFPANTVWYLWLLVLGVVLASRPSTPAP